VEAVETGSVYVHCDVTAVFPWLTHALLNEPKNKRKPMRLMDRMADALSFLDADVQKRRKSLMKTLDWSVEDAEPSTEEDAEKHEAFVR
jgi:deoxyhypusine synthase